MKRAAEEKRSRFKDLYFAFLLGLNARDFRDAARAFEEALSGGVGERELERDMEAGAAAVRVMRGMRGGAVLRG